MSQIKNIDDLIKWARRKQPTETNKRLPLITLITLGIIIFCAVIFLLIMYPSKTGINDEIILDDFDKTQEMETLSDDN